MQLRFFLLCSAVFFLQIARHYSWVELQYSKSVAVCEELALHSICQDDGSGRGGEENGLGAVVLKGFET